MRVATARQVTFADAELIRQGVCLEPTLAAISQFLDTQEEMIERVRRDLVRGLKNPDKGRPGLTASQALRSLVLMRIKNWDYRELRERIADGCTLRQFTDFYCDEVPKHDAFNRGINRLTPETLASVNDMVVEAAVELGLEDAGKLRVVVRLVFAWRRRKGQRRIKGFRDRRRAARRRMQELQRMTARQRGERQTETYRALIEIAEEVVANAKAALDATGKSRGKDTQAMLEIDALRAEIAHCCDLGDRVISQARRRVLNGEEVPNAEKIFSIFEPHTDLIMRGKVRTPVEFGHKVFLAESAIGLTTQYEVLDGNPADEIHVVPPLGRHRQTFHHAPKLYAGDRGFDSERNVTTCEKAAVKMICVPQRGGGRTAEREALEKSAAFKKGRKFRAGGEGRISVLFRGRGMKRCLAEGKLHFELFVGAAVLANNLMIIAAQLSKRSSRRRKVIH